MAGTGWGQGSPNLTFAQLEQLWIKNGGDPSQAATAAAIALAESGGNPNALGDGGDSCGLWQIDTAYHPQYSCSWLQNPANNVAAAMNISGNGSSWTPWTTYCASGNGINCVGPGQGTFRNYLGGNAPSPVGGNAPPSIGGWNNLPSDILGGIVSGVEGIAGGIFTDIENFLQPLFGGMVSPYLRLPQSLINLGWNIGGFVIGVLLIVLSGWFLFGAIFEEGFQLIGDKADDAIAAVKGQALSKIADALPEVAL